MMPFNSRGYVSFDGGIAFYIRGSMKKTFKDPFGRTITNKSKLDFAKEPDYWNKSYDCELCGTTHRFDEMSTCERCLRFVCDDCSEVVSNRENNPFPEWDFLCNDCVKELTHNVSYKK